MRSQENHRLLFRRAVMALAVAVALLCAAGALSAQAKGDDGRLYFVQVSDTHWGFNNPKINPDFAGTLKKGIAEINSLEGAPDFLIFTGDETHITNDESARPQRMTQFKDMIADLDVKTIRFIPGEHDASLDNAKDYTEFFGETHYTFEVKGVHFIVLDNVTNPDGSLGEGQLSWLSGVLGGLDTAAPLIVFAHRPLMDVYPSWGWRTKDGAQAMALLKPFSNVTLFYGHIHQEREDAQEGFTQHAAQGMMFPLPKPGSTDKPNPLPWDPAHPYRGLGFRTVVLDLKTGQFTIREYGITPEGKLAPAQ
jgi:3',5'-cyclic AMP phosphodiesterase CpdA